jgi:predicted nucleic acid-binding protein
MEAQAKLEIQQQIRDKKLELTVSYILEAENAANPFAAKKTDIQMFIDRYAKILVSRNMDVEVRKKASEIMKTGVKLMDACHVACAILAECDVFFTTDKRLLKYCSDEIRVMNPAAFILEQEGEG